jgi:hypothetical protein
VLREQLDIERERLTSVIATFTGSPIEIESNESSENHREVRRKNTWEAQKARMIARARLEDKERRENEKAKN